MIGQLKDTYPVERICSVLDCPRSSYYYQVEPRADGALVDAIEQLLLRKPFFGYRRIAAQLRREGRIVNTKVVRRILKELGVQHKVGQVRIRTTDSSHPHWRYPNLVQGVQPKQPNQVWVADVTYIRLDNSFIFLAVILDVYSRAVRGWAVRRDLTKELTLSALRMALQQATPYIHHSDQGVQYTAFDYTDLLRQHEVRISMADTGEPTQNGLAERFMRTIKEELVDYADWHSFDEAYRHIQHWLEVEYNVCRIHSALYYATPAEIDALWGNSSLRTLVPFLN
jgi:transposase InsO family protein